MINTMFTWLKWKIAGKELLELHRWRVKWQEYRRWLAEFEEVGITLDNMKSEVDGEGLSASYPPVDVGPWTVDALREHLRGKGRAKVPSPPLPPPVRSRHDGEPPVTG